MSEFLDLLFGEVRLPGGVAKEAVSHYGRTHGAALVKNSSLGVAVAPLLRNRSASEMLDLLKTKNQGVLGFVLDGNDSRDTVVRGALQHWRLSEADLLRLTNRPLTQRTADFLVRGEYPRAVQKQALANASAGCQLEWLAKNERRNALFNEQLIRLAPEVTSISQLVAVLLLRRSARSVAVTSKIPGLKIAACWTELKRADQAGAVAFALKTKMAKSALNPKIGLLNQSGLDKGLREKLMIHLQREWSKEILFPRFRSTKTIRDRGVRKDIVGPGYMIANVKDPAHLDRIIKAALRSTAGHLNARSLAVTTPLLYELSLNKYLSTEQLERVGKGLALHADLLGGIRDAALGEALARVTHRLVNEHPHCALEGMHVDFASSLKDLGVANPTIQALTGSTERPKKSQPDKLAAAKRYRSVWPLEHVKEDTVSFLGSREHHSEALRVASPYFTKRLGRGNDPLSIRKWMIFLGLCQDSPDIALNTVINTARALARAEQVDEVADAEIAWRKTKTA